MKFADSVLVAISVVHAELYMNVGVLNAVGHSNMANVSYAIEIISEMFTIGSNRHDVYDRL